MDNTFTNNGAWGILFVPYPDSNPPVLGQTCTGTGGAELAGFGCVYDPEGDALLDNTFTDNGFFGNPSQRRLRPDRDQREGGRGTVSRATPRRPAAPRPDLEQSQPTCDGTAAVTNTGGPLLAQVLCDTGVSASSCPAGSHYPQATAVTMHPLPGDLPSMPNPCRGVPDNAWCPNGRPA